MASRVNTRFVLLLAGVLALIFAGVAGMLVVVKLKSGERYVARGDRAMAAGNYKDAEKFYSIAVNKEPQNVPRLLKWREALTRFTPETPQLYAEAFGAYVALQRQLAISKKTDVAAHREYLDLVLELAELSGDRGSWDRLISETEAHLRYFGPADGDQSQVLRRYRGLGRMRLLSLGTDVEAARIEEARQDLEIALARDPGDGPAAGAMAYWHQRQADELRELRDFEGERKHLQDGLAVLDRAAAANPGPGTVMLRLRYRADASTRGIERGADAAAYLAARRARLDELKPALADAFGAVMAADPAALRFSHAVDLHIAATAIDPGAADGLTAQAVERALAARPDAADLHFLRGRLHQSRNENEEAIACLQRLVDLKEPPVSLAGVRLFEFRKQAVFLQANSAIALSAAAPAGAQRDAADARVRELRDTLAALVAEDSPQLLFVDGKIAITRGNLAEAERKLERHSEVTGDEAFESFEVLTIRGQIAARTGQPGQAVELYEKALDKRPDAVAVRVALAEVHAQLQQYGDAMKQYRVVLEQEPEHPEARERFAILAGLTGTTSAAAPQDPVVQLMVRAERVFRGSPGAAADPEGAIDLVRRSLPQHKNDPRLILQIVGFCLQVNDEAGARAAMEQGLQLHPDHEGLRNLKRQFEAQSSFEIASEIVEAAGLSEVDRLAQMYVLYRQHGRAAEAEETITRLTSLAPEDPRVLEWRLLAALDRKDFEQAQRLAADAQRVNIDGAGGLTYLARIQLARGDLAGGAQTLRQALEKGPENIPTRRLLAQTLQNLGRPTEAEEVYRAALRLNPADRETIKGLLRSLVQGRRMQQALQVARESEQYARVDPEFVNMLYDLEAMVGDRRAALEGRERLAARSPGDARNAAALAQLYLDGRDWAKARALLDTLRARQDSIVLVGLDARWHADQGDLEQARATWADYLEKLAREQTEPPSPQPYIAFGEFLMQRGDVENALVAFREAARYDGPAREASVYLADRLASLGRQGEAEAIYREVLDAGTPDPQMQITARLVEALLQQGKLDEAEQRIASAGPAAAEDLSLLVLGAAAAERRPDPRRARQLLDRAVERYPDQHLPYFRRALLSASDPAYFDDALADLDQCTRLRPDFWQAYTTRADINFSRGREEDALRDLRTAVDSNPMIDELRTTLIVQLLRRGREQEASAVGDDGLKARPTDAVFATGLGDVFAAHEQWNRSVPFYRNAWLIRKDPFAAAGYGLALLRSTPPALSEADTLLADPGAQTDRQPGLLVLRAWLRMKQNQPQRAEADAAAAYAVAVTDAGLLNSWREGVWLAWPDAPARLRLLDKLGPREQNAGWFHLFRAQTLGADPAHRTQAIAAMEKVLAENSEPALVVETCRALDTLYRAEGDIEKALGAARRGLAVNENDVMLNNNAASYLSERLGRHAEALPFAQKALAGAPGNPTVLDTLAHVHIALKEWGPAQEVLAQGLRVASTPTDKARFYLLRVRTRADAGDKAGARADAADLRVLLGDNPQALNDEQRRTLDELESRIR